MSDNLGRGISVAVAPTPAVPLPGWSADAAIAIYGDTDKKLKLKIPGHIADPDDPTETDEKDRDVLISGIDTSVNGHNVLGLGIESAEGYEKVMEKIAKKMRDGKIPENIFQGDPVVEYIVGSKKKKEEGTVNTSVGLVASPSLDAEFFAAIAEDLADAVESDLVPLASTVVVDDHVFSEDTTLGTPENPQVTVIEGNRVKIQDGATVSGTGTLIIHGDVEIKNDSTLKFDGDIIITGTNPGKTVREAKLKNKKGIVQVDGNVILLGTGKGKAKLEIHNEEDPEDESAETYFNGAVFVFSGIEETKDKAEVKIKKGHVTMNGLLAIIGDKAKLDIKKGKKVAHPRKPHLVTDFTMDGGIVVAVPDDEKGTKAEVKLDGHVTVTYNSEKLESALTSLLEFAQQFGPANPFPMKYSVVSWREVPVPAEHLQ